MATTDVNIAAKGKKTSETSAIIVNNHYCKQKIKISFNALAKVKLEAQMQALTLDALIAEP